MLIENPFNDTAVAFSNKSDKELKKAHFLFKIMGYSKLVALGSFLTKVMLEWNLPITGIIKSTIFDHFCGGTTEKECKPVVDKMYIKNVHSILDYSVEGKEEESDFDRVIQKKIQLIKHAANNDALPFEVVKPTGIGRFYIWQKITEKKKLSFEETAEWERIVDRVHELCRQAVASDVPLLFDGEETWMQDAADDLILDMMRIYNKSKAIVYNTVQCYRHDRFDYIQKLYQDAVFHDYVVGAKIVRGAYMEKERDRAMELGYSSPICSDKEASDKMFNEVMKFILHRLDRVKLCIGTHNESSTLQAMQILNDNRIKTDSDDVWFGQLYGMSDNLTFNLGNLNYNTFKILPFGPVKEVIPYLIRRAQENTSVAGQMGRELTLIKEELTRRNL